VLLTRRPSWLEVETRWAGRCGPTQGVDALDDFDGEFPRRPWLDVV